MVAHESCRAQTTGPQSTFLQELVVILYLDLCGFQSCFTHVSSIYQTGVH